MNLNEQRAPLIHNKMHEEEDVEERLYNRFKRRSFESVHLLLLILISLSLTPQVLTTSNINSVWLSKDEAAQDRSASSRSASWLPKQQQQTARANEEVRQVRVGEQASQLQASSSSLEPSIVSLDGEAPTNWQSYNRRSDSDTTQLLSYPRPEEASLLLDHLWSSNHSNNAQVHFDEEAKGANFSANFRNFRRHENTTRAPVHEDTIVITVAPEITNSSQMSFEEEREYAKRPRSNSATNTSTSQPFIYYLAQNDKWNTVESPSEMPLSSFGSLPQRRRKLHNSGTQYDLRRQTQTPLESVVTMNAPDERYSLANQDFDWARPPGHFSPANRVPRTTPMPIPYRTQQQRHRMRHPDFSSAPIQLDQRVSGTADFGRQQRVSAARKSLLTALSNRLNNWVDVSQRDQRLESTFFNQANQMQRQRRIRMPAPSQWSQANYYQLADSAEDSGSHAQRGFYPHREPAVHSLAHYYGQQAAVQQPTVAPAPSALDRFYGPNGGVQRRRRRPMNSLSGQPAGFIPVVAVSVSKTSPAPRPGEQLVESQNDDLDEYFKLKLGAANNRQRNVMIQRAPEDFGNLASGSVADLRQRMAQKQPSSEHTTTVKSAVFGYLPHQVADQNGPLLQAIGMLPQYAARTAHYPTAGLASASDDSAPEPANFNPQPEEAVEEPPSLALQLQANSYVQNDIAHPFFDTNLRKTRPMDVYPSQQHNFHDFQSLYKPEVGVPQNPLLEAASELNPLMPAFVLASPQAARFVHQPQAATPSNTETPEEEADNKGTKKRSSEFFASAGQLLLSALPLLLAPTLGLMFAASPNPIARYQSHSFAPASSNTLKHGIPSTYINSLNAGAVSNPSPSPQLFTPTPPGYLLTSTTPASRAANKTAKPTLAPLNGRSNSLPNTSAIPRATSTTLAPYEHLNKTHYQDLNSSASNSNDNNATLVLQDNELDVSRLKNHYDIGYEGVDFDAQFPSLMKSNSSSMLNKQLGYLDQGTLSLQKPARTKNQYQYSEVSPSNKSEELDAKLYPVSTWPAMRRRTVSLVTSLGNKTLPDSSHKYPELGSRSIAPEDFDSEDSDELIQLANSSTTVAPLISQAIAGNFVALSGDQLARSKRDTFAQETGRNRSKRVKIAKGPIISNSSTDQMRGDASKSKAAHIITTMITHMDDETNPTRPDEVKEWQIEQKEVRDLKEQLLNKKILLDRIASSGLTESDSPDLSDNRDESDLDNLAAGGRGRFPPTSLRNSIKSRRTVNMSRSDSGRHSGLVLADDTRKALENFGSLLIKDTLKIPPQENQHRAAKARNPQHRNRHQQRVEDYEASATERTMMYTTPFPEGTVGLPSGNDEADRAREQAEWRREQSAFYAPARRLRANDTEQYRPLRERANLLPDPEPAYASGDQYNSADNYQAYAPAPAPAPKYKAGPSNSVQAFNLYTMNHVPSPSNRSNLAPDQYNSPDGRYAKFVPEREPPRGHAYPPEPFAPPSNGHSGPYRAREQQYINTNFADSSQPTGYPPQTESQQNVGGNQYTTYAPNTYNSYNSPAMYHNHVGHKQQQQQGAASYNHHQSQQIGFNNHHPNEDYPAQPITNNHFHSLADPLPDREPYQHQQQPKLFHSQSATEQIRNPNREIDGIPPGGYGAPPTSYGADYYHQQQQQQQPKYPPRHYQQDATGNYYPNAASPPGASSASSSAMSNSMAALGMVSADKGDARIMNEYLDRVQFNDSDRDKLMASYLTCDGLLNDNDHCLERLSCEFSDPRNIEKANKLDRAVSSILLGHILINTYIPNQFKLRLKSASLVGYTQSGRCSKFVCNKLTRPNSTDRA